MVEFTKRQQEIIDVSINLIAEKGIQNLTIKNISEKMNMSEAAIYRHFTSKLEILEAILGYFESTLKNNLEILKLNNISNLEKLENTFLTLCKEFEKNPSLAKVIFSEEIFQNEQLLSKKVFEIMNEHQKFISELIEKAQENNEIRNDISKDYLSLIIMGTLRLIVTRWRLSNFNFNLSNQGYEVWNSIKNLLIKEN